MIPHRVTQETMENIDPNDTTIPTDIIKAINDTAYDRLTTSRDTNYEARTDSKTRAIAATAQARQIVFSLEIDAHVGVMNIHVLTHPYATCHVLDVAAHNINLRIENVLNR